MEALRGSDDVPLDLEATVAVVVVAVVAVAVVLVAVLVMGAILPMAMATSLAGRVGVTTLLGISALAIWAMAGISFTFVAVTCRFG